MNLFQPAAFKGGPLLISQLCSIDGLVSWMSAPGEAEDRKNFPDARIFLRMLRPDVERSRER